MDPIVEDIFKISKGVDPILNHHLTPTSALILWSCYLTDLGIKLRKQSNEEQRKKYKELGVAYEQIRAALSQTFLQEYELAAHEHNVKIYRSRISELENKIKALEQSNEFLK